MFDWWGVEPGNLQNRSGGQSLIIVRCLGGSGDFLTSAIIWAMPLETPFSMATRSSKLLGYFFGLRNPYYWPYIISNNQVVYKTIWRFPEIGVPNNGWFLLEKPVNNGWLGGIPIQETSICTSMKHKNPIWMIWLWYDGRGCTRFMDTTITLW